AHAVRGVERRQRADQELSADTGAADDAARRRCARVTGESAADRSRNAIGERAGSLHRLSREHGGLWRGGPRLQIAAGHHCMIASRNFLLALAAVVIAPFVLLLLPGGAPSVPQLSAATMAPMAVAAEDAAAHDGSFATVQGLVREVHTARSG